MSQTAPWWEGRHCSSIQLALYGTAKLLLAACLTVYAASVCHCIIPSSHLALQLSGLFFSPVHFSSAHTSSPFHSKVLAVFKLVSFFYSFSFLALLCQLAFLIDTLLPSNSPIRNFFFLLQDTHAFQRTLWIPNDSYVFLQASPPSLYASPPTVSKV